MEKTGDATSTYKMNLYCKHQEWLAETKKKYNQVLSFYHELLEKHPEFWELSNQNALRQLEVLMLTSRSKELPVIPLPIKFVPVYFRRFAINVALAFFHSYRGRLAHFYSTRPLKLGLW